MSEENSGYVIVNTHMIPVAVSTKEETEARAKELE